MGVEGDTAMREGSGLEKLDWIRINQPRPRKAGSYGKFTIWKTKEKNKSSRN